MFSKYQFSGHSIHSLVREHGQSGVEMGDTLLTTLPETHPLKNLLLKVKIRNQEGQTPITRALKLKDYNVSEVLMRFLLLHHEKQSRGTELILNQKLVAFSTLV